MRRSKQVKRNFSGACQEGRSIASVTTSFGVVAIPVKLYSPTISSERISFDLLRQNDGSRVNEPYVAVSVSGRPPHRDNHLGDDMQGYSLADLKRLITLPPALIRKLSQA